MSALFTASGRNGSVELHDGYIVIKRRFGGIKRMLTKGDLEIFLDTIKSVRFKQANALTFGYIQFVTKDNADKLKTASLMSAPNDEYTVNFNRKKQAEFEELKELINKKRNNI